MKNVKEKILVILAELLVSAILGVIVSIAVFGPHISIITHRYENRTWHGDGWVSADSVKIETKLFGGELISEERCEVTYHQRLDEFLADKSGITSVSYNFR